MSRIKMSRPSPFNKIRKEAGVENNCPVVIVDGSCPPQLTGKRAFWKKGNHIIVGHPPRYPGYEYHRSTRHVEVGAGWVAEHLPQYDVLRIMQQNMNRFVEMK